MLFEELIKCIKEEDYYRTEEMLNLVQLRCDAFEYVDRLLRFMEENPSVNYGMPGPIVHYMEQFYLSGYENSLYNSMVRRPTSHTLWMLNRLLNSTDLVDRERYLTLLEDVVESAVVSSDIREEAACYLRFQQEKEE